MTKVFLAITMSLFFCERVSADCYKQETRTGSYYKPYKGDWMIKVEPKRDGRFPAHEEPERDKNGKIVFEETILIKKQEIENQAVQVDCPQ